MADIDILIDLKGEISIEREMSDHLRRQIMELNRQVQENDLPDGSFQIGIEYLMEALGEIRVIDQNGNPEPQIIEPAIGEQYREDIGEDYGFDFCGYCKAFKWDESEDLCFICQEEME